MDERQALVRPDIVVIGASAGGLEPLKQLMCDFPDDLAATVFITVHTGPHRSLLPDILNYCHALPARHPANDERIEPRHIYVAPPDMHLLIEGDQVKLSRGPRENLTRPAIDPMFRSAAHAYGARVIGIILSGGLGDGTAGLAEIKRCGGITLVQDPAEAQDSSMPHSALQHVTIDYCLPVQGIAALLLQLLGRTEKLPDPVARDHPPQPREKVMSGDYSLMPPKSLICPDCGGALSESNIGAMPYYRCHIGHSFSAADMEAGQFNEMERALEVGFRIMAERVALCRRFRKMADETGNTRQSEDWQTAEAQASERAVTLRRFLDQSWLRPSPVGE